MGMTQERQREIQASLFKMLGQADDPRDERDPAEPRPSSKRNSVNGSSSEDNGVTTG